jgi:hypothetical protein
MSGQVDVLAREANALAGELRVGADFEIAARQQRLFHRLLDAGRSLEQEETSDERTAERSWQHPAGRPRRDRAETAGGRRATARPRRRSLAASGGYRQLILEYFQRLNRLLHEPETGQDAGPRRAASSDLPCGQRTLAAATPPGRRPMPWGPAR